MSSGGRRRPGLRKVFAQVGVAIFVLDLLSPIFLPFLSLAAGSLALPAYLWLQLGILFLFVASLLPSSAEEEWGSIWPLAGYDNAIDAIYTRGPWMSQFETLAESDREGRVSDAMNMIFG